MGRLFQDDSNNVSSALCQMQTYNHYQGLSLGLGQIYNLVKIKNCSNVFKPL